jgi:hypothetical protein
MQPAGRVMVSPAVEYRGILLHFFLVIKHGHSLYNAKGVYLHSRDRVRQEVATPKRLN